MKRVLIFTYYWPPSGGAGVQRWLKFSKFLPEFGWEPIIITVDPNKATYPVLDNSLQEESKGQIQVIRTNSSEWFSFYKKVSGSEKVPYAGFATERKITSLKQKAARFVRGNFFLPDPRKGWNKYAIKAAREVIDNTKVDCIITTSPPHSTQLIGMSLSREFNIPWIADLRDPWTEIYYYKEFYPTYLAHRINLKMEQEVLENANCITTVSPFLKSMFEKKIKDKNKIAVLTNGYDPDDFQIKSAQESKQFIVTYLGTMTSIYPIDSFLNAFKDHIKTNPDSLFRAIGTISQDQRNKITRLPEKNYELIPYVDHKTAISYLYKTSVLLLIIPSHFSNQGIVTGKLFEYLAVGKPIIFLGPQENDGANIITSGKSGRCFNYSDSSAIKETLDEWEKSVPTNEPPVQYNRRNLTSSLVNIIEDVIKIT